MKRSLKHLTGPPAQVSRRSGTAHEFFRRAFQTNALQSSGQFANALSNGISHGLSYELFYTPSMHIVIIGAGLTGVSTAWYLRRAGHQVTVVERREAAAMETSFANGGQVSLSHPEPWANPQAPLTILRWLGRRDAPLLFRLPAEPARWRWGMEFLRECTPYRAHRNTLAIGRLAAYSGHLLKELRSETGIEYKQLQRGILHLYFNKADLQHGQRQSRILQDLGINANVLTPEQCVDYDAALSSVLPRLRRRHARP